MAFSYSKILLLVVMIILTIFVASPHDGVDARPLLSHFQHSKEYELSFPILPNNPAPESGGSKDHPIALI
ncbi:unnamed protein product [Lupinus luteus]|uniref:Transmembrane protein n=1 Tax=Lupinus luteus TaxID=3873 RepID=A0AAV1WMW2_LUPLU